MARIFCLSCREEAGIAGAQSRPVGSSRQIYSTMRGNSWSLIDVDGNFICFRPGGTGRRRELRLVRCRTRKDPPVEELRKYGYEPEGDADYRHRMLVNFLATIVVSP